MKKNWEIYGHTESGEIVSLHKFPTRNEGFLCIHSDGSSSYKSVDRIKQEYKKCKIDFQSFKDIVSKNIEGDLLNDMEYLLNGANSIKQLLEERKTERLDSIFE